MAITIRPARVTDEKAIKGLIRQVRINPFGLQWQRFLIAEEIGDAGVGRFVGCVQIKPHADGTRELASLAVIPEKQGQGIGTELIEALLEREAGELYLMCIDHLATYYQQFGFSRVEAPAIPQSFRRYVRIAGWLQRWFGIEALVIMRTAVN